MRRRVLWVVFTIACSSVAVYFVAGRQHVHATSRPPAFGTVTAICGTMARTLRLTGQTSARSSANIVAPKQTGPEDNAELILVKLAKPGSLVQNGETIAEIDAQPLKDHLEEIKDTVGQAQADIVKRKAEQSADWATLEQTLRVAKADLDKAKLDAKTTPLLTDIERELLQLAVDEADARYKELQKEVALRKLSNEAELRILEITAERHQRHHDRHSVDLSRFTIRAPIGGLAVMQPIWRDAEMGQVRLGDRVRPGRLFMKVVDPRTMQVEAFANQAESGDLRVGQEAEIHLDAFPDMNFSGHVYSIGALATTSGWRQNYYIRRVPVRIAIDGQDPRLIPDLSASTDVTVAVSDPSIIVPLTAVHPREAGAVLYVKQGDRFIERMVTLGLADNTHVVVISGLSAGEAVRVD